MRGVRAVGELSGGVTGALMDPPWISSGGRCGRLFEWLEVENVWSQGRMGLASTPFTMLLECGRNGEDAPLGNEEDVGLALYDARGLGWYEEHGLGDTEHAMASMRSAGLHPCEHKKNTLLVCVSEEKSCYFHQLVKAHQMPV
jgi:hypothetical protein